mgnify:CR=1 FL=1
MDKVTLAIEFAAKAHDGMCRKKDKTPYILHPLEAAVIVGSMTENRDVISAVGALEATLYKLGYKFELGKGVATVIEALKEI